MEIKQAENTALVAYAYACKQLAFPAVDTVNLKTATEKKLPGATETI